MRKLATIRTVENIITEILMKTENAGTIEFKHGSLSLTEFTGKLQKILFSIPKDVAKENTKILINECFHEDERYWTFPSLSIQYARPFTEKEKEALKASFNQNAEESSSLRYEKYLELKAEFDGSTVESLK